MTLRHRLLGLALLLPLLAAACGTPAPRAADREAVAGRTWVVTGASSGIGRGVAERVGAMGGNVVLAARREGALEEVAAVIRASGGQALVVPTDVSRAEQVEALAEAAERRFGRVDVWFNNAGVAALGRFEEIPAAEHARVVEVNLNGVVFGSHAALRRFRAQGFGTLVNMASVEGRVPLAYHASYAATKHGVVGLDNALREELRLADSPVRLVTVMPWTVDTPFWGNAGNRTGRRPTGPLMDGAREVADAVVWAALWHPSGEFAVGPKAGLAVVGSHLAPRFTRHTAADIIHGMQMERAPPAPATPGNLFAPSPEPSRVEGGFSPRSGGPAAP